MNFLAHALLAGDDPALIVGGITGDWIKGPLPAGLPGDLACGVALHRAIDSHAESHPAFRRSRARMSPARRRYAGVLVDIFYDHLLAREWENHHEMPLAAFADRVYRLAGERIHELPPSSHYPLRLMSEQDWLASYAQIDDIADVLARMARRARQPNPLHGGVSEFLADDRGFESDFREWLDDARRHAAAWRARERGGSARSDRCGEA